MTAPAELRALNRGLTQADRIRAAPSPRQVKVDGRSLAQLLAFAAEYGRLITFYDLTDTRAGTWAPFFESDPTIALALRVALDMGSVRAGFDATLAALRTAEAHAARLEHMGRALDGVRRLGWLLTAGETGGSGDMDGTLSALATSARRDLLAQPARALQLHLAGMAPAAALRRDRGDWLPALVERLDALAAALVTALDQGRAGAITQLQDTLDDDAHPPQSGLYDAFAMLFRHAQDTVNRFPARLLRFYRDDVLRQTRRAGRPDSVYLAFTTAKGVGHVELPRGTRFLAGTDPDGESIAYALDEAVSVDAADVVALRTLRVTAEPARGAMPSLPAQVLMGSVALADKPPRIAEPFPLFGAEAVGTEGSLVSVAATLGFAVATPTLMLAGGTRTVTLDFTLTAASHAAAWSLCETLGAAVGGMSAESVFATLMGAAFQLDYSTAAGWVSIARYDATPIAADDLAFALVFVLDPDAEPFVAPSPAAGATGPAADVGAPVLAARLAQQPVLLGSDLAAGIVGIPVYPYALVSLLGLAALEIGTEVACFVPPDVWTPAGAVDTSQPFPVFGTPPVQGSSISLTAPELFAKSLDSLTIALDWYGLPVTTTGFRGYYKAYVVDADGQRVPAGSQYDNGSFKGLLTLANPGWWTIRAPGHDFKLFSPDHGMVDPSSLYEAHVRRATPPSYYDPRESAVTLTLTAPDTAFGDVLYAPNVVAASIQLTAAASACAQQCGQAPKHGALPGPLAALIAANQDGSDGSWAARILSTVEQTAAALEDVARNAAEQAIAAIEGAAETLEAWYASFAEAVATARASLGERLRDWWSGDDEASPPGERLRAWLDANGAALPTAQPALVAKAQALLDAARDVRLLLDRVAALPVGIARATVAAEAGRIQARLGEFGEPDAADCVNECLKNAHLAGFPNQPWLPQASRIVVNYRAHGRLPAVDATLPPARYFHLLAFDGIAEVEWSVAGVPMLAPIPQAGALYVTLSEPAAALTLLFHLAPPPEGWPRDTAPIAWAQASGTGGWMPLTPLRDTTDDMRNSGLVSLAPAPVPEGAPFELRLSVQRDAGGFPDLAALLPNAATASWIGPGGGAEVGAPLSPGTITRPAAPVDGLGSVDQPLASSGGAPTLTGKALEPWLSERLHHKERGIQGWDYAALALAAFPSLWQVAVVPASNGKDDGVPGAVWVVAVPGPSTPAIADRTEPTNIAQTLEDIRTYLQARVSAFVALTVTDPPYLRLCVQADLVFTRDDTVEACKARLNDELIAYLSPWPSAEIGPRPADYYTRREVAHFVRSRPYVRAILALRLVPEGDARGWCYFTSALAHDLDGRAETDEGRVGALLRGAA